jgi:hypothetical protein
MTKNDTLGELALALLPCKNPEVFKLFLKLYIWVKTHKGPPNCSHTYNIFAINFFGNVRTSHFG